jgi:microcystin degradation protein MlrC
MTTARVGVASISQETNTFSPLPSTVADFEASGILEGPDMGPAVAGTNTEAAGALAALDGTGAVGVPVIRAWAMSSGRLTEGALADLCDRLRRRLRQAAPLDALVLSMHGALAADGTDSADLALLRAARAEVGPDTPIGVCLDLHANVTEPLVAECDVLIGYHTYPHVDQGETGARIARLVLTRLSGADLVTRMAKRPMILPGEGQAIDGPLGILRALADARTRPPILDISLFPVQPWLDVARLGSAVTVTSAGDPGAAEALAEDLADRFWDARDAFAVELVPPVEALDRARAAVRRPIVMSESADSPTAGTPADSPAMVRTLLEQGGDLRAMVTLVDRTAVDRCAVAGPGARVSLTVGAGVERRFHDPVPLTGEVRLVGDGRHRLEGPVFTGLQVSMGRFAVVTTGRLDVLLTERPACTFDPTAFRHAGLSPEETDVVVVRSAHLFRAGWGPMADGAMILDLPGASTPRLSSLHFTRAPRPLYPVDAA